MADEEKHHIVRTLKAEFDENGSKLRQVRGPGGAGQGLGDRGRDQGRRAAIASPQLAAAAARPPPPPAVERSRPPPLPARPAANPRLNLPARLGAQLEGQKRSVEAGLRRAAFTAAQLDELPEHARTYRSVGKA